MILSWILNALSSDLASSVVYSDTAKDIWDDLRERFSQKNITRIFEIRRDIARHLQNQQLINIYLTKLKSLWDELDSYKLIPSCSFVSNEVLKAFNDDAETMKVMQVLMGLDESYAAIRGHILLLNPLSNIRQIYLMLT